MEYSSGGLFAWTGTRCGSSIAKNNQHELPETSRFPDFGNFGAFPYPETSRSPYKGREFGTGIGKLSMIRLRHMRSTHSPTK